MSGSLRGVGGQHTTQRPVGRHSKALLVQMNHSEFGRTFECTGTVGTWLRSTANARWTGSLIDASACFHRVMDSACSFMLPPHTPGCGLLLLSSTLAKVPKAKVNHQNHSENFMVFVGAEEGEGRRDELFGEASGADCRLVHCCRTCIEEMLLAMLV